MTLALAIWSVAGQRLLSYCAMSEHADADAHAHAPHDELLRTSALQQTLTPPEAKTSDEAVGEPPTAFYNDTIAIINAFAEDIQDVECDDADGTAAAGNDSNDDSNGESNGDSNGDSNDTNVAPGAIGG
jgi:hypothetical protein